MQPTFTSIELKYSYQETGIRINSIMYEILLNICNLEVTNVVQELLASK